ncbi:hypothetical protein L484_008074 [Morus notabilis]|uniref:Uncharacterized protein n=1 Tax=Morus notabilis TaxID=981085 RepID=W9RDJ3_9ROSA|nr:hypothetical protein L484_008074 [Morus notabilis]
MTIEESHPAEIPDLYFPEDPFEHDDFLIIDEVVATFPDPRYYLFDARAASTNSPSPLADQSFRDSFLDCESIAVVFHPRDEDHEMIPAPTT